MKKFISEMKDRQCSLKNIVFTHLTMQIADIGSIVFREIFQSKEVTRDPPAIGSDDHVLLQYSEISL